MAVRRLSPVFHKRRLRPARRPGATAPCAATLVSCLVGGHCLRISVFGADIGRDRVREDCATWRDRLGFRGGLSGDSQPAGSAEYHYWRGWIGGNALALRCRVACADGP